MKKYIPMSVLHNEWMKNPAYRKAYDDLAEEYELMAELIRARAAAKLTQAQVAKRMATTQSVVARVESGRVPPSSRTLQRYAAALGMRMQVRLVPIEKKKPTKKR